MIIPVSKNLRTSSAGAARGVFIESMTDGFVAVDADWRFTYLNPKAYELLQAVRQSQEELVGQNMWLAGNQAPPQCRMRLASHVRIFLQADNRGCVR